MNRALEVGRGICAEAGFDPELVDAAMLEAAIRRRMLTTGLADAGDYLQRLSATSAEQQELLEELLVRESWFFRDETPFQLLGQFVRERWLARGAERPLYVLSAPCAGGEEPYSIAMALAGAGLSTSHYQIDAVDLSRRGLESARLARYGRNAVRHVPTTLARDFLDFTHDEYVEVRASLRETVRLHWGNLLDLPAALRGRRYEVIFCRNVLIYLGAAARARVLMQLEELLAPGGFIVVGHAEPGLLVGRAWEPLGVPGAFAFERRQLTATRAPNPPRQPPRRIRARAPSAPKPLAKKPATSVQSTTPEPSAARVSSIRALADAGAYGEAGRQAEELIAVEPVCADAYYLLGLIRAAEGDSPQARRAFERAAYLDPQHEPALRHLALLLEAAGERSAALRLQRRAARVGGVDP